MISPLEFLISRRYLFPKTKDSFFSVITIFSFLGISLGVATLIIVMSVMNGFRDELTSKVLGVNGHMKIKLQKNIRINNYDNLSKSLNVKDFNLKFHPTIISQALISVNGISSGVILKGLSYKSLRERDLISNNLSPRSASDFENNEGILIGSRLKEKLNIRKNDFVKILSSELQTTPFGSLINSADYNVVGFFETGMYEYDLSLIIMPLEMLQNFLNIGQQVDSIEIILDDFEDLDRINKEILSNLPDYFQLFDWRKLNPSLFNAIEVERNVMFLILFLIIVVAAFNLISSMTMLVNNKRKDIGILRSLGITREQVVKIFIINGFFIGFIGTILGLFLGLTFCLNINEIKSLLEILLGLDLFSEEIYFFSKLPILIDYKEIGLIIILSLLLSFLATIYPSYKASKVQPISLIKWE